MTSETYFDQIRNLVKRDELDQAIQLVSQLLKNTPKLDEAILQEARWNDIKKQIRLGLVEFSTGQTQKSRIRKGILELVRDIETQTDRPELKEEAAQYFGSIQITGKNIVSSSTIQAGGSINIGDQNIHNVTESKTSRRLRLFLFLFVPILAITFAVLYYRYQVSQQPLELDVTLEDQTPNPYLPYEGGQLILQYDGKSETQSIQNEFTFEAIPSNNRDKSVRLRFAAKGFYPIDTLVMLNNQPVTLPIHRDNTYASMYGSVVDEDQQPIEGAKVFIEDIQLSTSTDAGGQFSFEIPLSKQRPSHRLKVTKEGYLPDDRENGEPVNQDRAVRIMLHKN